MNKKGMTTIELITSFALATVIFIILFNLLITLKDIYIVSGSKTNMLIEQSNLSKALNESINSDNVLQKIQVLSDDEYVFVTNSGEKKLLIDLSNNVISFDKYTMQVPNNVSISNNDSKYINWNNISSYVHTYDNKLLVVDIPLVDAKNNEKYNIKLVYQTDGVLEIEY